MTTRRALLLVTATESRYMVQDGQYYVILKGTTGVVTDSRIYLKPKPNTKPSIKKGRDNDDHGPVVLLSVHWDVAIMGRDMKRPKGRHWETSCFEEPNVEIEGVEFLEMEFADDEAPEPKSPRRRRLRVLQHRPPMPPTSSAKPS